jgi:hypothetical protein
MNETDLSDISPEVMQAARSLVDAWYQDEFKAGGPKISPIRLARLARCIGRLMDEIDRLHAVYEAALRVARLNYDRADSIRPMTNGAQDAFHALEDAAQAYLGERWEYPQEDDDDA